VYFKKNIAYWLNIAHAKSESELILVKVLK